MVTVDPDDGRTKVCRPRSVLVRGFPDVSDDDVEEGRSDEDEDGRSDEEDDEDDDEVVPREDVEVCRLAGTKVEALFRTPDRVDVPRGEVERLEPKVEPRVEPRVEEPRVDVSSAMDDFRLVDDFLLVDDSGMLWSKVKVSSSLHLLLSLLPAWTAMLFD